jgi:hypothetical protein
MAVRLSSLRTGHVLLPRNIIFLLLVLISFRGLVLLEELGKLHKLIYLIGFRTRDLPACSIVSQPLHYRVRTGAEENIWTEER